MGERFWGFRRGLIAPGGLSEWLVVDKILGPSNGGGERADAVERVEVVAVPGPAGGEVQRPAPRVGGQAAGDLEEPAAEGAGGADRRVGQAEQLRPAQQVVRQAGEHGPGGVRVE